MNNPHMTIEGARKLIPENEKYSNAEIEKITDDLYALADIIFETWITKKRPQTEKKQGVEGV